MQIQRPIDAVTAGPHLRSRPSRWWAVAAGLLLASTVLFVIGVAELPPKGPGLTNGVSGYLGVDYDFHLEAARRWLRGGSPYLAFQLAGPYSVTLQGGFLYPPPILYLLVPFAYLPAVLWWAIPGSLLVAALVPWKPGPRSCVVIGLLCLLPQVHEPIQYGNPVMWLVAAEAWGLLLGWPAVAVLLKPSLAVFALVGVRRKSWWIGLGIALAAAITFGSMWVDWWTAIEHGDAGLLYSARQVPVMIIPIVAWAGRARSPSSTYSA